jgi:peptidylprolyl isomerase
MAQAQSGNTVRVNYTVRDRNGEVFDTNSGREPLQFTPGEGRLISGFEQAVVGMSVGETRSVTIPAAQAYGTQAADLVFTVKRERFPEGLNPREGQRLELRSDDGESLQVLVVSTSDTEVTLDANHPLAGMDLALEVGLVEIL